MLTAFNFNFTFKKQTNRDLSSLVCGIELVLHQLPIKDLWVSPFTLLSRLYPLKKVPTTLRIVPRIKGHGGWEVLCKLHRCGVICIILDRDQSLTIQDTHIWASGTKPQRSLPPTFSHRPTSHATTTEIFQHHAPVSKMLVSFLLLAFPMDSSQFSWWSSALVREQFSAFT